MQRRRELGIRIALGASAGRRVRLVMQGGIRLVFVGILLGAAIALAAGRAIASLLFQESPSDPVVYAIVAAALVCVAHSWQAPSPQPWPPASTPALRSGRTLR